MKYWLRDTRGASEPPHCLACRAAGILLNSQFSSNYFSVSQVEQNFPDFAADFEGRSAWQSVCRGALGVRVRVSMVGLVGLGAVQHAMGGRARPVWRPIHPRHLPFKRGLPPPCFAGLPCLQTSAACRATAASGGSTAPRTMGSRATMRRQSSSRPRLVAAEGGGAAGCWVCWTTCAFGCARRLLISACNAMSVCLYTLLYNV